MILFRRNKGGRILGKIIKYVVSFESIEELKRHYDKIRKKIFKLYKKYDPNLEFEKQLTDSGRFKLLSMKTVIKEELNKDLDIDPKTLYDFNHLWSILVNYTYSSIDDRILNTEDAISSLIQEYFSMLVAFKETIDNEGK